MSFEEYEKPTGDLKYITEAISKMISLESEIKVQEGKLKDLKAKHFEYETDKIPSLMNELGLRKLSLETGHEIEIRPIIKASLPSAGAIQKAKGDRRAELEAKLEDGLDYIRSKGGESLIKHHLSLEFSRGSEEIVRQFIDKAQANDIPLKNQETVLPQTLSKFVEELICKGEDVPEDTLGVFSGQKANVKKPKK
jgi:hypothetical protein